MKLAAWLIHPQKRLGAPGLMALLVIAALITPISLDMYTPAIPHMTEFFDTDAGMVNLTLVGFFLFYAVGLLLFGPVSDKFGRKPVLLVGSIAYAAASALCALSTSIEMLIIMRVAQALGAGAMNAVATAIVKDAIVIDRRGAMLAFVQVMAVLGPMLAPIIGAAVVMLADWHTTFWILAVVGVVCSVLSALFTETLPPEDRTEEGGLRALAGLGAVAKNAGFSLYLIATACVSLPYMAYVAVASHIYITFFGLSELAYGGFFAAAAAASAIGPFIWVFASKRMSARRYTSLMFVVGFVVGAGILVVGGASPFVFCGLFFVFALIEASVRPMSAEILLSQQEKNAGAASSLINFMHTALGSLGMAIAVLPWPNYIVGIGASMAASMLIAIAVWAALLKSDAPLIGVKGGFQKK